MLFLFGLFYLPIGFGFARFVKANRGSWCRNTDDLVITTFLWPVVMPPWFTAYLHSRMDKNG
jgi:hypothetical protein